MRSLERLRRARREVRYADPLHTGRHPFQTYLLLLALTAGIPQLISDRSDAHAHVTRDLPHWLILAWGVMLVLGAAAALLGSFWPGDRVDGLTMERIGLLFVGGAGVVYAVLILYYVRPPTYLSALLTLGFGLACLRRSHDCAKIMHTAIEKTAPGVDGGAS